MRPGIRDDRISSGGFVLKQNKFWLCFFIFILSLLFSQNSYAEQGEEIYAPKSESEVHGVEEHVQPPKEHRTSKEDSVHAKPKEGKETKIKSYPAAKGDSKSMDPHKKAMTDDGFPTPTELPSAQIQPGQQAHENKLDEKDGSRNAKVKQSFTTATNYVAGHGENKTTGSASNSSQKIPIDQKEIIEKPVAHIEEHQSQSKNKVQEEKEKILKEKSLENHDAKKDEGAHDSKKDEGAHEAKKDEDAHDSKKDEGAHDEKTAEKEIKIVENKLVDVDEKNVEEKKYTGILWFLGVFISLLIVIFAFT